MQKKNIPYTGLPLDPTTEKSSEKPISVHNVEFLKLDLKIALNLYRPEWYNYVC